MELGAFTASVLPEVARVALRALRRSPARAHPHVRADRRSRGDLPGFHADLTRASIDVKSWSRSKGCSTTTRFRDRMAGIGAMTGGRDRDGCVGPIVDRRARLRRPQGLPVLGLPEPRVRRPSARPATATTATWCASRKQCIRSCGALADPRRPVMADDRGAPPPKRDVQHHRVDDPPSSTSPTASRCQPAQPAHLSRWQRRARVQPSSPTAPAAVQGLRLFAVVCPSLDGSQLIPATPRDVVLIFGMINMIGGECDSESVTADDRGVGSSVPEAAWPCSRKSGPHARHRHQRVLPPPGLRSPQCRQCLVSVEKNPAAPSCQQTAARQAAVRPTCSRRSRASSSSSSRS